MLTVIALSAALAQEPTPPPAPPERHARFVMMGPQGAGSLDRDGDGQITREEFAAPMNDHFARMDKNGDGRLSTEELASGHGEGGDHDVKIMRRPGGPGAHHFEVRPLEGARAEGEREIILHGPGGHGASRVIHLPGDGEHRMEIAAVGGGGRAELDQDGDGRISEAEFTAPLREAFGAMDADHSGFIEEGEHRDDRNVRVFTHRLESRREGDQ